MMQTYVDAGLAPRKNDGQIKLYGRGGLRRHAQGRPARRRMPRRGRRHRPRPACRPSRSTASSTSSPCDHGALPATLGYNGYTKSSCISINHVVCHGIPSDKPLRDGDIVNIDVTLIVDGWHGDSSRMYPVGDVKRAAERLIEVTYEAMMRGIAGDPARRHHRRHRPRHPGIRRGRALQRRARFLRPRRRPPVPRRAQHPPLRQPRRGHRR